MKLRSISIDDELSFVVSKILKLLKTRGRFDPFFCLYHPGYPSLLSIKDSLINSGVKVKAANFKSKDLHSIPTPAVTYFRQEKEENEFIIIRKINLGMVLIERFNSGLQKVPVEEFKNKWDGYVLLVENDSTHYQVPESEAENATSNLSTAGVLFFVLAFGILLITALSYGRIGFPWIILVLNILGIVITSLLVTKELFPHKDFKVIDKFCEGENLSCKSVLNSKAAHLLSWISWSEVGFIYFAGATLSILISATSNLLIEVLGLLAVISLGSAPFIIYSIYYQGFVLRKWCFLCLVTQLLLGILLFLYYGFLYTFDGQNIFLATSICLISISICSAVWLLTKGLLANNSTIMNYKERVTLFKADIEYFEYALKSGEQFTGVYLNPDVEFGSKEAVIKIVGVLSFDCAYCLTICKELLTLRNKFGDNINVRIIFSTRNATVKDNPLFINMQSEQCNDHNLQLLEAWLNSENNNKRVKTQISDIQSIDRAEIIALERLEWLNKNRINATPTVFINNSKMKEGLSLLDFDFYFRKKISYEN